MTVGKKTEFQTFLYHGSKFPWSCMTCNHFLCGSLELEMQEVVFNTVVLTMILNDQNHMRSTGYLQTTDNSDKMLK